MPVVWKHQLQTTDSHESPLSSEKVVSVLVSVSHPKETTEYKRAAKKQQTGEK